MRKHFYTVMQFILILGGLVTESTVEAWISEESVIAKEGDKGRGLYTI